MNSRSFIITVGATLALLVTSANAAVINRNGRPDAHARLTAAQKHGNAAKGAMTSTSARKVSAPFATPQILAAPFPSYPIVTPRYNYSPGAPPGSAVPYVGDCETSGNNCTVQQLCEVWGVNCPVAVAPDLSAEASATSGALITSG